MDGQIRFFLLLPIFLSLQESPSCANNDLRFQYSPSNLTVLENTSALFHCYPLLSTLLPSSYSSSSSIPSSLSLITPSPTSSPPLPSPSPAPKSQISIQWFWNDKKIDSRRARFDVKGGSNYSIMVIQHAKKKLSGTIRCEVSRSDSGQVLAVSRTGFLKVVHRNEAPAGFPETDQAGSAKTFQSMREFSLSCQPSGDPIPSIRWFKDYDPVDMSDGRISISESGNDLKFGSALLTDKGKYVCLASNPFGSSFSAPIHAFVKERSIHPYFSVKPENQQVWYGGSVSLRCVVVGTPMPTVEWTMGDGSRVENSVVGEGSYDINVSDIRRSMTLTCKGSSKRGQIQCNVNITVILDNQGVKDISTSNNSTLINHDNHLTDHDNHHSFNDDGDVGISSTNSRFNLDDFTNNLNYNPYPKSNSDLYPNQDPDNILLLYPPLHTPYTPLPQVSLLNDHSLLVTLQHPKEHSLFNEDIHKDWSYYLVVVTEAVYDKLPRNFQLEKLLKASSSSSQAWACGLFSPSELPLEFVVGDGEIRQKRLANGKLDLKRISYKLFVRLVTDQGQEYSSEYSQIVRRMGDGMGVDEMRGGDMEVGEMRGGDMGVGGLWGNSWLLIAIPLLLAIVLVLIIIFTIAIIRRKSNFSKKKMTYNSLRLIEQSDLLMNDARYSPASNNVESFYSGSITSQIKPNGINQTSLTTTDPLPIRLSDLKARIERLKHNDGTLLHKEYESIDPGKHFTWKASSDEDNASKNRYANVVAYDHSRVVLKHLIAEGINGYMSNSMTNNGAGVVGSNDYINANLISGVNNKQYIATQGPLPETCGDFWKMVWQSGSRLVVMLTKLEERNKVKCDQYWPSEGSQTYAGTLRVYTKEQLQLSFYTVRTFTLTLTTSQETREVFHLQFTDWPDLGTPTHPTKLLHFVNRIRCAYTMNLPSPIIVHCSAGVGRTGCVIAIDMCLDQLNNNYNYNNNYNKSPNLSPKNLSPNHFITTRNVPNNNNFNNDTTIDIFSTIKHLRSFRNYMVQSEDQYLFIHDTLLESTLCAYNTEVPANDLPLHFCRLQQEQAVEYEDGLDASGKSMNKMELEFQCLSTVCHAPSSFTTATLPCNNFKNKDPSVLPLDSNRVTLQAIRGVEGSDYINASFIDGYRNKQAYIATQSPSDEGLNELWRMVWEREVEVIVMLDYQEKSSAYWAVDRSRRFNCFVLDPFPCQNFGCYVLRQFRMTDARDGKSRMISQFQLVDWSLEGGVFGVTGSQFSSLIGRVEGMRETCQPIMVHCWKGAGRTGVFIGACNVVERARLEGVVNVYESVRLLRTQRPGLVSTIAEYSFLYESLSEYLKNLAAK